MDQPQRAQRLDQMQLAVGRTRRNPRSRRAGRPAAASSSARSPDSSIHRSCTAGPMRRRRSRRSAGPAGRSTARCPRGSRRAGAVVRTSPARSKQRATPSSASATTLRPRVAQVGGDEVVREQEVARLVAEARDVERGRVRERRDARRPRGCAR